MDEQHVEEETANNNPSDGLKIKKTVLDNFRNLTKQKEKFRIKAGANLVKYLLDNEEVETERNYALGRLIRGLGSSTAEARCGFYSTLTPLLKYSEISVSQIFEYVKKELHKGKSNSKSENADICSGKILLCCALIRSSLFERSTREEKTEILKCLLSAGKERSYLLYPSFQILLEVVEQINKNDFRELVFPLIEQDLDKPWTEYNLDTFYLLMNLRNKYAKIIGNQIMKKITGSTELISENNLKQIANILTDIPRIASLKHPVYEAFVKILVKTEHSVLFMSHIDEILSKYNKNKHLVTINLLIFILNNTENPNDVPSLLGENLIKHTLSVFRQIKGGEKDLELKQFTHKLFDAVVTALKKESVTDKTKISVLKKLLFSPGTFIFEKITKSKLIQQITATLEAGGVKKIGKIYQDVILLQNEKFNMQTNETFQNNDRLYAAHLLVKLMAHPLINDDLKWKCDQLKFLMRLGILKQPKVGVELASSLRDTFYRSLDVKLSKLDDLSTVLLEIFQDLDSELNENNLETVFRFSVSTETYNVWCKTKSLILKIESKKTKKVRLLFQILFLHLGLQLFNNEIKLAKDSLEELFSCYERVTKHKHSDSESDPEWIEVIVELFLSLLSHNSHLLRKIIGFVFPHFCKYLNATAIHQILSVVDPKNEENPLTNKNNVSDDEEESETSENEEKEENSDEEESDEEESDESSEEEEIEESSTDKLRKALQLALMHDGINKNDESDDIDLDELDEEEGEKLNQALGDVFKQYRPKSGRGKKKQTKNEETLTHFRIRVLDLIEIYLDSNPSMILALEIMLPLLQILEFSIKDDHQKPLRDRVKHCLKKLANLKKFEDVNDVNDKVICDLLGSLLEKGTRSSLITQFMGDEIAYCCSFIIRCSQCLVNSEETPKKIKKHVKNGVCDIIGNSLEIYLKNRDCSTPLVIFKQILQMNWTGNIKLLRRLISVIFEEGIKPFRRSQAVELLKILYSNHRLLNCDEVKDKNKLIEITREFLEKCSEFFSEHDIQNYAKKQIKEKFISFVFALLPIVKNCPIKIDDFDWKNFGEIVREFRSNLNINQETRKSFNKLCGALELKNVVEMKSETFKFGDKNDDDNHRENGAKKMKNNKGLKNKDKLKLKKEAKEERMKSLGEGLDVEFSNVGVMNGEGIEDNVEVNGDEINLKKRKSSNDNIKKHKKIKT